MAMSKKGENIYKRKDGRWEGRYIKNHAPDGSAKYGYVYARTYREVKDKLIYQKSHIDLLAGVNPSSQTPVFFQQIAAEWLASVEPHIKESTSARYRNLLQTYILPVWGNITLYDINCEKLDVYFRNLLIGGGAKSNGLSPKSVSDILTLMRSILRYASDTGRAVVCDGKSIHIKKADKELRVLSRNEQDILCQYLYSDLNKKNMGILICLFTGLRVGELCALRWEDISVKEKTIHVCQTMQRIQTHENPEKKTKIIVTPPKSQCSFRKIPLPDTLVKILEEQPQCRTGYFLTDSSQKFIEPRTMQNHFKRVLKKCGIEEANFHALRHTFATRCVELGFDVKSLSEILGHANVNITMNRYVHPSMELKRENMQMLSGLLVVK